MNQLAKKKVKGMTLVEIIVALCIFTIMTGAMASCASTASKLSIADAEFREKMNTQGPTADNKGSANFVTNDISGVRIKFDKVTKNCKGTHFVGKGTSDPSDPSKTSSMDNGMNYSYFEIDNTVDDKP